MAAPRSVSRRTALGGVVSGVALLGVAGCGIDLPGGVDGTRPRTLAQVGPDEKLVVEVLAVLTRSADLLTRTGARYPRLAARLAPFVEAQRTQLAVLRNAARANVLPTTTPSPAPLAPTRAGALAAARTELEAVRTACLGAAVRAESGQFARLLASIGVAVSQRLPALDVAGAESAT